MKKHLFDTICQLSKQDRKTLSQKVLKLGEEFGELAKVALPFDNAYATTHRFTERESILEEAADSILCALSVAYDLEFTHSEIFEMMEHKAEKWALLQSKECNISYPLPYEIHVTVRAKPHTNYPGGFVEYFKQCCERLEVKPIVLDLQDKAGETAMFDVMTSSKHFGTNASAYKEASKQAYFLGEIFDVVRTKIETVPWHPAAPVGTQPMPPNCYFESHIPVELLPEELEGLKESIALYEDLHMSRNVFKRNENGNVVQMLTLRKYDGTLTSFQQRLNQIVQSLTRAWTIGKVITEFSIYDTKISHDSKWITS